ncbi:MAG: dTDP-4-dehydrorhamnose reductase [Thermoflexales bacterium]|nr:dTDP-4-dehydrorhamnose reductase [Thermoflexales bacterium]
MRVLITGANGQLGRDLVAVLSTKHEVLATRRRSLLGDDDLPFPPLALDVTEPKEVQTTLHSFQPQVVINCAAYHRVDEIERDASQAFAVNALAVHRLALTCREVDAALVHISTDYVFDGAKRAPYVESDPPNPLSAYGASKLAGELLLRNTWHKHYIVRTCGLYGIAGASGKGGNFVNTMLRLAAEGKPIRVVNDQVCTPTFTHDLAQQIATLIETAAYGTYHITNDGACSWYEFACAIFELAGLKPTVQPISSAEYGAPARRPPYSVLQNAALQALGIDHMRHWREALAAYIALKHRQL